MQVHNAYGDWLMEAMGYHNVPFETAFLVYQDVGLRASECALLCLRQEFEHDSDRENREEFKLRKRLLEIQDEQHAANERNYAAWLFTGRFHHREDFHPDDVARQPADVQAAYAERQAWRNSDDD